MKPVLRVVLILTVVPFAAWLWPSAWPLGGVLTLAILSLTEEVGRG